VARLLVVGRDHQGAWDAIGYVKGVKNVAPTPGLIADYGRFQRPRVESNPVWTMPELERLAPAANSPAASSTTARTPPALRS